MSQSLAVKYRPKNLKDGLIEQNITVTILEKQLEKGSFKNVYLFSGPTGVGKTTIARCFANAINNNIGDPIELDCASQNSVDNVRAIVDSANERSLTGIYKIFILDEVQMFSNAAWNAMLKYIEEPAPFTIFILCTTEINKVPATVLNRVQRFNLSSISHKGIKTRLEYICQQEGFINYESACDLISKLGRGSMRDAIMYLDKCADFSHDLSLENTKQILGDVDAETMLRLTNYIYEGKEDKVLEILEALANGTQDLKQFVSAYLDFILDLTKYALFKNISITNIPAYLENATDKYISVVYTSKIELKFFNGFMDHLLKLKTEIKYDTSYKSTIEVYLLKACRG